MINNLNSLNETNPGVKINFKNEKESLEKLLSSSIEEIASLKKTQFTIETNLKSEKLINDAKYQLMSKQMSLFKEKKLKVEEDLEIATNSFSVEITQLNDEISQLKESKSHLEKILENQKGKSKRDLSALIKSIENYNCAREIENSAREKNETKLKNLKKDYEELNQQLKYERDLRSKYEKKTHELKEKHRNALLKIDFLENKLMTIFELNNNITMLEKEFYSSNNFTTKLQEQHKEQINQLKEQLSRDFLEINYNLKNVASSFTSPE